MEDADTAVIIERLDQHDKKLDEVLVQVKKTNGRVTALEMTRAVDEALSKRSETDSATWRTGAIAMACVIVGWVLPHLHLHF
jgi:hypothetical protein